MTINGVREIFHSVARQKGLNLEERPSRSTNSWYFILHGVSTSLLFRVSDHPTRNNVITLRIDKRLSADRVKAFMANRCADLGVRQRDTYFAQIS